ncbi:uncharacterized protein sb:cb288 isoform X2 [Pristis pectinata]|uniref:uncharacterized protein sb:cb288 isoform X2 n=1 Tax=Pristis pectinata TaxID=685728 RepID=UPI00223D56CB|nr:uncharacterized protein sb:cb288 isoform X2 [Pristis pectinata]
MKQFAENATQTRQSLTLNSGKQNITGLPEPCATGSCMDNQKLLPVHNQTNGPSAANGIIPGMIAATIFIVFLLGLYTILWKCMSFQTKRHRGSGRSKLRVSHSPSISC